MVVGHATRKETTFVREMNENVSAITQEEALEAVTYEPYCCFDQAWT